MRRIASLIPVLFVASIAQAVTLQILTLDEMTQKSTSVVYAKVLDSYGALHGSMIYTHYHVQVMENWKGTTRHRDHAAGRHGQRLPPDLRRCSSVLPPEIVMSCSCGPVPLVRHN